MQFSNDVVLRPRFNMELSIAPNVILDAFEKTNETNQDFVISRIDNHVFIRIPKKAQHFWSPQLHLEIYKTEKQPTIVKGLFGPSPTVWTLFMFLHFMVATLFIAAGIWIYTNISLGDSYTVPLLGLIILLLLWFILYAGGRLGRKAGHSEMRALHFFMKQVIDKTN